MKRRTEILAAVLLAYSTGCVDGAGLTPTEWEWAETTIETRFGGDFDVVDYGRSYADALETLRAHQGPNK